MKDSGAFSNTLNKFVSSLHILESISADFPDLLLINKKNNFPAASEMSDVCDLGDSPSLSFSNKPAWLCSALLLVFPLRSTMMMEYGSGSMMKQ